MWLNFDYVIIDYLAVLVFLERWLRKWLLTDHIIIWWRQKRVQKGDQGMNDVTNVWKLAHKTNKLWNHYMPITAWTLYINLRSSLYFRKLINLWSIWLCFHVIFFSKNSKSEQWKSCDHNMIKKVINTFEKPMPCILLQKMKCLSVRRIKYYYFQPFIEYGVNYWFITWSTRMASCKLCCATLCLAKIVKFGWKSKSGATCR